MMYKGFNDYITRKHGIVLEGWPLHVFDNPNSVGSQVELNVLLRAWQTGVTRFRRMTEAEHMAWLESRANLEPPSTGIAGTPPAIQMLQDNHQDTSPAPPASLPIIHSSFNIVPLELADPQTSNNAPKKPRKIRSDKGKPRKKSSQIPGMNTFRTGAQ